jgi:hypothetical protein
VLRVSVIGGGLRLRFERTPIYHTALLDCTFVRNFGTCWAASDVGPDCATVAADLCAK